MLQTTYFSFNIVACNIITYTRCSNIACNSFMQQCCESCMVGFNSFDGVISHLCMFCSFISFISLFFSIAETHLLWPIHGMDDILPEKCLLGCVALAIRKTSLLYIILTTKQQLVIHDPVSSGGDGVNILTRLTIAEQMDTMLQKVKNQTTRYLINVLIAGVAEELNIPIPPKVAYVVDLQVPTPTTTTNLTPYLQQAKAFGLYKLTRPMSEVSAFPSSSRPLLAISAFPTHAYNEIQHHYRLTDVVMGMRFLGYLLQGLIRDEAFFYEQTTTETNISSSSSLQINPRGRQNLAPKMQKLCASIHERLLERPRKRKLTAAAATTTSPLTRAPTPTSFIPATPISFSSHISQHFDFPQPVCRKCLVSSIILVTVEQRSYTMPLNIVLENASLARVCSQLPYRMQPRVTQVYNLLTQGPPHQSQLSACPLNRSKRFRTQFKALVTQLMKEVKFMRLTEQIYFDFQAHHICLECGGNRTKENNSVHSVYRAIHIERAPPNSIWRTRSACLTLHMPTLVRIEQGPHARCTPAISRLLSSLDFLEKTLV